MLDTAYKASLLRRNGVAIPELSAEGTGPWRAAVDALFDEYVAVRARRSLREAEEAHELELLSRLAATSYPRRRITNYA
ncbi:hypothetical protein H6CHR_00194 [Variovorax sp. PBL-H6]|uniref:hypothetical protein n=1 Tax=Variovorax sp. PBL-H6 TaxID=434009 RepID=UPI0013161B4B|nr:hypothetical protein [Variovorax sp. PBL-H6]VTU15329.1 hypothetical protein H6CHR_00194 [Variovorax sp. PBL-H6]